VTPFPTISPMQAKGLAGKRWTVDGHEYCFGSDVHLGKEAFLYPLLDESGDLVAYLRLLNALAVSPERIHRTEWLVAMRLDQRSPAFEAAPRAWATTLHSGRVPGVDHDFAGTLHTAVPGMSWRNLKLAAEDGRLSLPSLAVRQQIAREFLFQLADFEEMGFIHGDLSDGNIVVDPKRGDCRLVDVDAFVYEGDSRLKHPQLSLSAGGVKGTPSYMPPDLEATESLTELPYSDRHARDMLLIELLCFTPGDPVETSPKNWGEWETLRETLRPVASSLGLGHLLQENLFNMGENERPTSRQLAMGLGWKPTADRPAPPKSLEEQIEDLAWGPWGAGAAASLIGVTVYLFALILLRGSGLTWLVLLAMLGGTIWLVREDASLIWKRWERTGFSLRRLLELFRVSEGR